jgi:hypothetical protein
MKSRLNLAIVLFSLFATSNTASAQAVLQRFVLVAGANSGGTDRPLLRYALSDAERFERVLTDLGGVNSPDAMVLKEPKVRSLVEGLNWLSERVSQARQTAGPGRSRTEILVYYSGHADEKGLLLGDDRYSYQSLRERLDEIPADVRIAVLDACASGAFTRLKGGKVLKPFMVDEATEMQGHAFLTSSAETEAAQESDYLGASYFTHYLVSGLRGAADTNSDGKITLNEAYQFAFKETLGQTVNSQGGAQHPSYDIKLSGTGDVIITDVRQTTATLALAATIEGRVFVRNARQELVVELYKARGHAVELGLEPGTYEVRIQRPPEAWVAKSQLGKGQRLELALDQFSPTKPEPTRPRGIEAPRYSVAGRNRIELRVGMWRGTQGAASSLPNLALGTDAADLLAGLQYTRFVREDLAITFGADVFPSASSIVSQAGAFAGSTAVVALPLGVRWNPMRGELRSRAVKPYLIAGFGPVIGTASGASTDFTSAFAGSQSAATAGGFLGAGVDVLTGRRWSIGVNAGYNWMADFSRPIGGRDNYSGFQVAVGLGFLFGKGYWGQP